MDFRAPSQEVGDKENQGVPEKFQDGELPRVVSILKSSQRANCPLEKKLTKVRLCLLEHVTVIWPWKFLGYPYQKS